MFWDQALAAIDAEDGRGAADAAAQAAGRASRRAGGDSGEYTFQHHLLHQVTYGGVLKEQRRARPRARRRLLERARRGEEPARRDAGGVPRARRGARPSPARRRRRPSPPGSTRSSSTTSTPTPTPDAAAAGAVGGRALRARLRAGPRRDRARADQPGAHGGLPPRDGRGRAGAAPCARDPGARARRRIISTRRGRSRCSAATSRAAATTPPRSRSSGARSTCASALLGREHPLTVGTLSDRRVPRQGARSPRRSREPQPTRAAGARAHLGPETPETAIALTALGEVLAKTGDAGGAEPLFRRALVASQQRQLDADNPDIGLTMWNLAEVLRALGQLRRSRDAGAAHPRDLGTQLRARARMDGVGTDLLSRGAARARRWRREAIVARRARGANRRARVRQRRTRSWRIDARPARARPAGRRPPRERRAGAGARARDPARRSAREGTRAAEATRAWLASCRAANRCGRRIAGDSRSHREDPTPVRGVERIFARANATLLRRMAAIFAPTNPEIRPTDGGAAMNRPARQVALARHAIRIGCSRRSPDRTAGSSSCSLASALCRRRPRRGRRDEGGRRARRCSLRDRSSISADRQLFIGNTAGGIGSIGTVNVAGGGVLTAAQIVAGFGGLGTGFVNVGGAGSIIHLTGGAANNGLDIGSWGTGVRHRRDRRLDRLRVVRGVPVQPHRQRRGLDRDAGDQRRLGDGSRAGRGRPAERCSTGFGTPGANTSGTLTISNGGTLSSSGFSAVASNSGLTGAVSGNALDRRRRIELEHFARLRRRWPGRAGHRAATRTARPPRRSATAAA